MLGTFVTAMGVWYVHNALLSGDDGPPVTVNEWRNVAEVQWQLVAIPAAIVFICLLVHAVWEFIIELDPQVRQTRERAKAREVRFYAWLAAKKAEEKLAELYSESNDSFVEKEIAAWNKRVGLAGRLKVAIVRIMAKLNTKNYSICPNPPWYDPHEEFMRDLQGRN
jgi:hypothetical protein